MMRYLPILDELFSSDSFLFALIGLIAAVLAGIKMKKAKNSLTALLVCLAVYAVCEAVSNFGTDYLAEFAALVVGTVAIGGVIGFLISFVIAAVRR